MSAPDPVPGLLISIPTVIIACRAGGALARRVGQPPVVGEITTGILLGPSLLGWLWPAAQSWLIPPASIPYTGALGQLGLFVFMFLVGLELDLKALRGLGRTALVASQASIVVPLLLGAALAFGMYGTFAQKGIERLPFVLFIAVALSITAFPVLARILTDRHLYHTPLGALAMACAAVNDAMAWCLLAIVLALTHSGSSLGPVTTVGLAVVFLLGMLYVIRPVLTRWAARTAREAKAMAPVPGKDASDGGQDGRVLLILFAGLCLSALATDRIGLHGLFGAFLFGTAMPRQSIQIERAASRLRTVVVPLLLPLFFASTGLSTNVRVLGSDWTQWLWAGALCAVAVLGKWGGSAVAARACGEDWRRSLSLGALMNCRGLTELVVLSLGLELGVIQTRLYTILVLVALFTTALTSPALTWLGHREAGPAPAALDEHSLVPAGEPGARRDTGG